MGSFTSGFSRINKFEQNMYLTSFLAPSRFSSTGNINAVLLRRANHSEPTESKGPHDFPGLSASSGIHKDDEDDDDDGSVDQAPAHRRPSTTSPGSLHSEKSVLEAEPVLDHSTSQQPPPVRIYLRYRCTKFVLNLNQIHLSSTRLNLKPAHPITPNFRQTTLNQTTPYHPCPC